MRHSDDRLSPFAHVAMERFTATWEFDPATGCWMWQGTREQDGYGQITVLGQQWRAHRLGYTLHVGPIPEGLVIDHLCCIRACVNPDHLEAVTQAENLRRGPFALRTHCPYGHPYDAVNTAFDRGQRSCRACGRRKSAARAARKRLEAQAS